MIEPSSPGSLPAELPKSLWTAPRAVRSRRTDLDDLFLSSDAGLVPTGRSRGTALIATGTALGPMFVYATRLLFWKGKDFDTTSHDLLNRLSPFGFRAIRAAVRMDTSEIDGKPCIVLDYSKTSRVAKMIRDEIRQVGDSSYLGIVMIAGHQLPLYFFLDFS